MTTKLMIYSNLNFKKIFEQIFFNLNPEFKKLIDLNKRIKTTDCSIILVENLKIIKDFKLLKSDIVLTTQLHESENFVEANILKAPTDIRSLKNIVLNLILAKKNSFEHLTILDQKLINTKNKKYCFLTNIEKNILDELMKLNKIKRDEIKEKILNIKNNIETNSLDSHLTRIRKKIEKIDNEIKIVSKNEYILILQS